MNKGSTNQKKCLDSSLDGDELYFLKDIIKSVPGSVYWKDKDGLYLGCNDSLLDMAGMDDVVGKTDYDMPWAAQADVIRQNDIKVMQSGLTIEVEEYPTLANNQNTIVLTRKTPLKNLQGDIVGVIGISLNITERNKRVIDLIHLKEQTESTLENIVANMPGHVYWKDKNGVYLGCNNRQAMSLGLKHGEEVVGKTDFDLPWGKNIAALFQKNDFSIMENKKAEVIEEIAQVDGKEAIVLSHKAPMINKNGEVTGILGISIDISDRKKVEKDLILAKERAEAANDAKTEFLENMRHDIRTPLTGITGFANIISDEVKDPKIKEYVDNLSASSDALLNLLNEILEIIDINSGNAPIVTKKFNLKKRLEDVVLLYKAKSKQKNIEFSADFDSAIPQYLIGDSTRTHRIALELIANAFNFTKAGFVKLTTQLSKAEGRELIIKLMVQDSGIGIDSDKQEAIFVQFKRLTPSYKGLYKGAGLGLSIVKQFVDDLGGEIYVESSLGTGSIFTCILPYKKALLDESFGSEVVLPDPLISENENSVYQAASLCEEKQLLKSTVLVVEDNSIAAKDC